MAASLLDETELTAWRRMMRMSFQLSAALNRALTGESGLSYPDFVVLAVLADQDGGRMRPFELGRELGWEKSRLSHHVDRMADRGLVRRERCPTDQRGAFVAVTDEGRQAVEAAAPVHADVVRRAFLAVVGPDELATVGEVAARVLDHLSCSP